MTPATEIGWNAGAAAAEGLALAFVFGGKYPLYRTLSWVALAWLLAMSLAVPVGQEGFAVLRLFAWGLFAHAPACLLAVAVALRKRKWAAATLAVAAAALLAVAADAFLVEPRSLEARHVRVTSAKLKRPLRVAVIADLQTDDVGEFERRAIREAMVSKPDIVLLAGDYVQEDDDEKRRTQHEKLRQIFREESLVAPRGVFAVEGDNDSPDWLDIFEGLPVRTSTETVECEADGVRVVLLSLRDSRNVHLKRVAAAEFTIVLGHAPDFSLGDVRADLMVAGHTHGGQVQLPGFGPPITLSRIPRDQAAGGVFELDGRGTLVVSRGVGMERGSAPRLRFFCRPQVIVLDVMPGP